ncbi:F-box protein [Dorcoceras hygrometricum]|uniref:F-box protein n=1 Tax=Dorcoceras hygrometricum TaxID=472368 RepID=A0A2Z7B3X9_9LAMI|nr:F-box protein [Dorcoceras hygrometricum]
MVKSSNRVDDVSVAGMSCDADVNIAGLSDLSAKSVSSFDDVSISWLLSVGDVSIAGLSLLGENLLIDLMTSAACVVVVWMTLEPDFSGLVFGQCCLVLRLEDELGTPVYLISLLGFVSHYEWSG